MTKKMSVSTTTLVTTIGNLSGEKEVRGWPEQFQAARYCGWKPVGPGQYQINPMTVWGCCSCMPGNGTPWLGDELVIFFILSLCGREKKKFIFLALTL